MTTTAAALKVHALRTELDAIEAKAVSEARDLTPDEAERVDAIREQAKPDARVMGAPDIDRENEDPRSVM